MSMTIRGHSLVEHFEAENKAPNRGSLVTLAANLNDIADEHRATARVNERLLVVAGLIATLGCAIILALPNLLVSPFYAIGLFAFAAYAIYGRESNLREAVKFESGAAMALAKAALVPTWRGCGVITALFKILFSTNDDVLRFGHQRIGGQKV